jgi:hypothetical protein
MSDGLPHFDNPEWVESSYAQLFCLDDPEYPGCIEHVDSLYEYRLNLGANVALLALFSASLLGFLGVYAWKRIGLAFTVALCLGVLAEIIGYAGRVMSYYNQWNETGFYMQICCLTFGPAFLAAGIYLCLRRIVMAFGPENSRIPASWYTRIFIPCDFIALLLQASGGALAASSDDPQLGTDIMIAGLAFQVITGTGFIIAATDFALRAYRRYKQLGSNAFDQSPELVHMRGTMAFKGFIGALALASLCILVRSVFRVAELSEGWSGPIMARQDLFIGFEGVLILVACLILNVFHPAICMRPVLVGGGGLTGLWFAKKKTEEQELLRIKSRNNSDSV